MLMVRPHEKNDQDGLFSFRRLPSPQSSVANDPIAAGELRGGRCRRSELDRRRGAAYEPSVLLLTLIRHHTVPPFGRIGAADS
jgi:hypothetical protein